MFGVMAVMFTASCASWMGPPKAYDIEVEGVRPRQLAKEAVRVTEAEAFRTVPVTGVGALNRRVQPDAETMRRFLRSRGHYGAAVEVRVEEGRKRPVVIFSATNLQVFVVDRVEVEVLGLELAPTSGLRGEVAGFAEIRGDERSVRRQVMEKGFPLARTAERRVVADHETGKVEVRLVMEPGPEAVFGPVEIEGLNNVRERFVRNLIPWVEGERYAVGAVEEYRLRLAESGLFSMVEVSVTGEVDEHGVFPVQVRLAERRRQAVQAGVAYRTDQGFETSAGWQFRNVGGHGEALEVSGVWAEERIEAHVGLRLPQIRHPRQSLLLRVGYEEERPDAYSSKSFRASAMFDRELSRRVRVQPGVAFRVSEVDQLGEEEDYLLVSAPVGLVWSTRDDVLDPRSGHHFHGVVEPFYDLDSASLGFVKSRATERVYVKLTRDRSMILAGRLTVGSIAGAGVGSVPADERFYAGGGASVRGYGYQKIGPRKNGTPSGGRSLFESSGEIRYQFSESFGAVVFLDGGAVFEEAFTDFSETLRWGTGVGLRYFTGFGPLRADVGFPVNPATGERSSPQVYISIGQAF